MPAAQVSCFSGRRMNEFSVIVRLWCLEGSAVQTNRHPFMITLRVGGGGGGGMVAETGRSDPQGSHAKRGVGSK